MTPAAQLGLGFCLGCGLGLVYGFLRPLRRHRHWPADLLFVVAALLCWVYFSFGICHGSIRVLPTAAIAAGMIAWDATAGKLLRPVFHRFWCGIFALLRFFALPFKKIFQKCKVFVKKVFASLKKRGTMDKNKHKPNRQRKEGRSHGKKAQVQTENQAGFPV